MKEISANTRLPRAGAESELLCKELEELWRKVHRDTLCRGYGAGEPSATDIQEGEVATGTSGGDVCLFVKVGGVVKKVVLA